MKDFVYLTIISLFVLLASVHLYMDEVENLRINNEIKFIWNDDEESIPVDGSLIKIEFTDENTVYIGPFNPEDSLYKQHMNQTHKE